MGFKDTWKASRTPEREDIVKLFKENKINISLEMDVIKRLEQQLKSDEELLFLRRVPIESMNIKKQRGLFLVTTERIGYVLKANSIISKVDIVLFKKNELKSYNSNTKGISQIIHFVFQHDYLNVYLNTVLSQGLTEALGYEQVVDIKMNNDTDDQHQDLIEAIERLSKLRDAGILTEDEFSRKKAELLKKI